MIEGLVPSQIFDFLNKYNSRLSFSSCNICFLNFPLFTISPGSIKTDGNLWFIGLYTVDGEFPASDSAADRDGFWQICNST